MNAAALGQLLRLASPMLPVGAYSYSQGLEWAVECGDVHDEGSAADWTLAVLRATVGSFEAPAWRRIYEAWAAGDRESASRWNARFLAMRETAELRAETVQMGEALKLVLLATREVDTAPLDALGEVSFPAAFSFAAHALGVPVRDGLTGYLWAWGENQVAAAMKLVPLGQSAGQRILAKLVAALPAVTEHALQAGDDELGNFAPGLAIASSRHEIQYTRLFRS
jgi:urease accessory protein